MRVSIGGEPADVLMEGPDCLGVAVPEGTGTADVLVTNSRGETTRLQAVLTSVESDMMGAIPRWDVNADGVVDVLDLVLVATHFGELTK